MFSYSLQIPKVLEKNIYYSPGYFRSALSLPVNSCIVLEKNSSRFDVRENVG